ncbi:MAG: hypothetical protein IKE76_06185 [Clostridia bacterium]|jgi:hypothetical protein|nr:hypothetical protein [Clostridia bacterium]
MYKKQMKLQRIACFLSIAASALVFLYALGIMTDLYDMLYTMIPVPDDPSSVKVAGAMIYYDMQGFNQSLLKAGIGLILVSCLLFITSTHTRRKYYIGNYVAICLNAVANIGVALWAHGQIAAFKAQYLSTVDFAQLERRLSRAGTYTDSTFWFDVHTAIFAFALLVVFLLVVSTAWKVSLMRNEKKLIEAGKAVSA